jgi:pimeloyl-ACP methyl ester carboxylesterase
MGIISSKAFAFIIAFSLILSGAGGRVHVPQSADDKLSPKVYDSYLGAYQLRSGKLIIIGRSQRRLFCYEPDTGLTRGLDRGPNPQSELKWFAGTSLLVFSPIEFQLIFTKNNREEVTGLTVRRPGFPDQWAKKIKLYREERVTFRSGAETLAGTLLVPSTKGPHPAAVFVHGSGEQSRNGFVSIIRFAADHFARHGIAALIYDKRGVGESTGHWETETLDDLAADALAAHSFLLGYKGIDSRQVGLWGGSQAAWIMPKVAAQSRDVAFIISVSGAGGGISVGEQVLYNLEIDLGNAGFSQAEISEWKRAYKLLYELVRVGEGADTRQLEDILRKLQRNPKLTEALRKEWFLARPDPKIDWKKRDQWFFLYDPNFDAIPLWKEYGGPVLGVFGELDGLEPVREVVPLFARALASRKNPDFTIAVFPRGHHILMEMETDAPNDNELPNLKRYVPGYFDTMSDWLLKHLEVRTARNGKSRRK